MEFLWNLEEHGRVKKALSVKRSRQTETKKKTRHKDKRAAKTKSTRTKKRRRAKNGMATYTTKIIKVNGSSE